MDARMMHGCWCNYIAPHSITFRSVTWYDIHVTNHKQLNCRQPSNFWHFSQLSCERLIRIAFWNAGINDMYYKNHQNYTRALQAFNIEILQEIRSSIPMANSKEKSSTFAAAAAASRRCLPRSHTQNTTFAALHSPNCHVKIPCEIYTSGHARTWNFFEDGKLWETSSDQPRSESKERNRKK